MRLPKKSCMVLLVQLCVQCVRRCCCVLFTAFGVSVDPKPLVFGASVDPKPLVFGLFLPTTKGVSVPQGSSAAQVFTIIKRFSFSSERRRCACIVRAPDGAVWTFVKGAPEVVRRLAAPESVPLGLDEALLHHTSVCFEGMLPLTSR